MQKIGNWEGFSLHGARCRSHAPPTIACRARARVWAPRCLTANAPQQYERRRARVKSERRATYPRVKSEGKSLGATLPNRRRAAAVRAAMPRESVSRSRAPPSSRAERGQESGAMRDAAALPNRRPRRSSTCREAAQERKSEPRAAPAAVARAATTCES